MPGRFGAEYSDIACLLDIISLQEKNVKIGQYCVQCKDILDNLLAFRFPVRQAVFEPFSDNFSGFVRIRFSLQILQ